MSVGGYSGPIKPVVGILGGMGPAATADFISKLIARTPADVEFEHLALAVWSNPEIPDRTQALLGQGPSPVPAMVDGVRRLVAIGADSIAVPCNTAHAFLPEVRGQVDVPFIDMISATVDTVRHDYPRAGTVGLLATEGTRRAGLYAAECERRGLKIVNLPDKEQAALVNRAILAVKTGAEPGPARGWVRDAARLLQDLGAELVIAGCTEIPLVCDEARKVVPIVDATDCLASAVLKHALRPVERQADQGPELLVETRTAP